MNTLARLVTALLIAAGIAVSQGLERFRMSDRSVTVKGLAEKTWRATSPCGRCRYAARAMILAACGVRRAACGVRRAACGVRQALAGDRDKVWAFLKQRGFTDAEVETKPLQVQDFFTREYAQGNQPFRFNGTGQVLVKLAR